MNDEEVKKMIENTDIYDDSKEDTLRSMIGDFYNRRMLSSILLICVKIRALCPPALSLRRSKSSC